MHQIILLTAMTATSGLFGGGRATCASGTCGMTYAPAPAYSTCAPGTPCGGYVQQAPAPQQYYYPYPAAQPQAAPMAPPQAMAPQGYYPTAYYYPYVVLPRRHLLPALRRAERPATVRPASHNLGREGPRR